MSTASASSANRTSTDLIEKTMLLRAPRSKVWRALTDPEQFGAWFGARLTDPFTPGTRVRGPMVTPGHEQYVMDMTIDRVQPERLFSWRWHPGGDPNVDPAEPMTLVVFELEDVPEGTRLTLRESGFDQIPPARRANSYRGNEKGWTGQFENLQKYLASAA
jgi:uncharacterized protein YndB with AHSA1/START domain